MKTTPRKLNREQWETLKGLLWMADRAKRQSKDLKEALATWEAGAVQRGFADAREMLAAGPAAPDTSAVPPEVLARREMVRQMMREAGISSSLEVDRDRLQGR